MNESASKPFNADTLKFKAMITILTWVSIITGGILILFLLLSIIGGMDFEFELDHGSTDVETDAGGLGLIKGALTFISVTSWMIKVLLTANNHVGIATGIGIISGLVALVLLNYLFKLLMRNEENVNWSINDALFQDGQVYLKIPAPDGSGLVQVDINGAMRELKAKSVDQNEINTGESIIVMDIEGEYLLVQKKQS